MTKKEYVERNIGVSFDFIKHLIDHPEMLNTISNGGELDFVDKDIPLQTSIQPKKKKISRYRIQHTFESIKV